MRGWNRNHHPVISPADFQGQVRARDLVRDLLAAMVAAQSRFEQRHRIVRQQRQAKGTQRSLGISQGVDLTRQCRGNLKRLLLDSRVVDVPMSYHPIVMTLSWLCTKSRSFIGFLGIKIGLSGLEKAFKMRLKRSY